MSTLNCAEELDFRLLFEDQGRLAAAGPDVNVRSAPSLTQSLPKHPAVFEELHSYPPCFPPTDTHLYTDRYQHGPQYAAQGNSPRAFDCPSIHITSIAPNSHSELSGNHDALAVGGAERGYTPETAWTRGQLYLPLDGCYRDQVLCPSPCSSLSSRSWMSDLSSCESYSHVYDDVDGELREAACLALGGSPLGSPQGSPGCGGGAFGVELWQQKYQHPAAFSPSLSPHQSPAHSPRTSVTEDSWMNRRPTSRPSSRPTSPCGKRRHSGADPHARSPSPSPHHSPSPTPGASPRGSVTDDSWVGSPAAGALGALLMSSYTELDVPSKTRRTSGSQLGLQAGGTGCQGDPQIETFLLDSPAEDGRDQDGLAELFLQVPSHFSWNKPKPGNPPLFRASSPPPLDWPLPAQYEACELRLEVQPRSYHRAHYETEGSRGSIKASTQGHPVVKLEGYSDQPVSLLLFIGTADDRFLRPHSFYQVHRVTGKMVTTTCHEKILDFTKVLEIPLLPENNMSASIDCAGILKLRNADIELKKGETDIGRKNTRVRVVFRVAVPQSDGRMLWLQTTSVPVECSQRSGQELPQIESFSPNSCSVAGGTEMLISGSNISTQSRVVFIEKGPDGRSLWEMDARILTEKSSGSSLVVEVPPYSRKSSEPVQVQFYVSNGKRRKSLTHNFTFVPGGGRRHITQPQQQSPLTTNTAAVTMATPAAAVVKQEGWDTDRISHNASGFCATTFHDQILGPDLVYRSAPRLHHPAVPSAAPVMFSNLQTFHVPAPPSSGSRPKEPSPSLGNRRAIVPPAMELPKDCELQPLNIKQEPDESHQPNQGSLGLQEITLDDVNEIIDRDIGGLTGSDQFDPYHQFDWDSKNQ